MPDPDPPAGHSVADHAPGEWEAHEHGPDADHDHDDFAPGPLEENPIWLRDNVELTSVGIDVGSAGTQVIFSQVLLQRRPTDLSSRYVIVDRRTLFESEVAFTPYLDARRIDAAALGAIIDRAYAAAGVRPRDVDTGVVILTGEALRRGNSEPIARILAERGGDLVTATAGHHMEARLAAFGSGAARASHEAGGRILNIDIGGGTTKLALCEAGRVLRTAALDIGGRIVATAGGRVVRLDPAGAHHAGAAGRPLALGGRAGPEDMARIARSMARSLVAALRPDPPPEVAGLFLTDLPGEMPDLAGLVFSGGVGEYVYEREARDFGDLGPHLGRALRERLAAGDLPAPLLPAAACIRATALGASEHSVQLSGQTSLITRPGAVLPRRNLQVVRPDLDLGQDPPADLIAARIGAAFAGLDLDPATAEAALALGWSLLPDYPRLRRLAEGIALALAPRIAAGRALHVMIDGDIAQTLGGILRDELMVGVDMAVIDGIALHDFDFIDLGRIRLPSRTVPVTIKSLLFAEPPEGTGRIRFRAPPPAPRPHGHRQPGPDPGPGRHHHDADPRSTSRRGSV